MARFGFSIWVLIDRTLNRSVGYATYTSDLKPGEKATGPVYEIREIPGKGRGFVARRSIEKGTRILSEEPLLVLTPSKTTPNTMLECLWKHAAPKAFLEHKIALELESLPRSKQEEFRSLHNGRPYEPHLTGILGTNAWGGAEPETRIVFSTISLINHSCRPNANYSINQSNECASVFAMRKIRLGEEITVGYIGGPSYFRQPRLKASWGFDCQCEVCLLSPPEREKSDERREQIDNIGERLQQYVRIERAADIPNAALRDCYAWTKLCREEFGDIADYWNNQGYAAAVYLLRVQGDENRESVFLRRWLKAAAIGDDDYTEYYRKAKAYTNRLEERSTIPIGLRPKDFEKWLWKL